MESLYTNTHTYTRQLYSHAQPICIMCECKHESILSSQETKAIITINSFCQHTNAYARACVCVCELTRNVRILFLISNCKHDCTLAHSFAHLNSITLFFAAHIHSTKLIAGIKWSLFRQHWILLYWKSTRNKFKSMIVCVCACFFGTMATDTSIWNEY